MRQAKYKVRIGKIKNARGIQVGSLGEVDMDGRIVEKGSSPCSQ
jgi:hypothetical protein